MSSSSISKISTDLTGILGSRLFSPEASWQGMSRRRFPPTRRPSQQWDDLALTLFEFEGCVAIAGGIEFRSIAQVAGVVDPEQFAGLIELAGSGSNFDNAHGVLFAEFAVDRGELPSRVCRCCSRREGRSRQ